MVVNIKKAAAQSARDRGWAVVEAQPRQGSGLTWSIRGEALFEADAWNAGIKLCGASGAVGILSTPNASRRGVVFTSGLDDLGLAEDDVERLRQWIDRNALDFSRLQAEVRVIPNLSAEVALQTGIGALRSYDRLVAGRLPAPGEGTFYVLFCCKKTVPGVLEAFALTSHVLLQSAAGYVSSERRARQASLVEALADQMSAAMLLVDAEARILWSNAAAERVLASSTFLARRFGETLTANDSADNSALREAIRASYLLPNAGATEGDETADRLVRIGSESGEQRFVIVRPVCGRRYSPKGRAVGILLSSLDPSVLVSSIQCFAKEAGLLRSEIRFLAALIRTGSVSAAAGELGLSTSTGQTYLKRIYPKIGVSSQLELARIALTSLPLLARPGDREAK